ncbi:MAG: hypothetical protein JJU36_08310 [Phycisphaeraceae bacterium]|nr:hypothetical protein [Phycisphaeraceae bacterium]
MWKILAVIMVAVLVGAGTGIWLWTDSLDWREDFRGGESHYMAPEQIGELQSPAIVESSGLIASRRHPGLFWTHNDSGDRARLFLLGPKGEQMGEFQVQGARNIDWEDIAAIEFDGRPMLLVGDIGDNRARRREVQIYLVPEPEALPDDPDQPGTLSAQAAIRYRYEDGPRDAESLAFDPVHRVILIVDKPWRLGQIPARKDVRPGLYEVPWPEELDNQTVRTASRVADLPMGIPTAMDLSPDGRRLIVLTYGDAFEWIRDGDERWSDVIREHEPIQVAMPIRRQGEAIAYDLEGQALYTTTEQRHSPFWRIRIDPNAEIP